MPRPSNVAMPKARCPGRYRFSSDDFREGDHVGWFESPIGLLGSKGEWAVIRTADAYRIGVAKPETTAARLGLPLVTRAAAIAGYVSIPDAERARKRGVGGWEFEFNRSVNAGHFGPLGGPSVYFDWHNVSVLPLGVADAENAVTVLLGKESEFSAEERSRAVSALTGGTTQSMLDELSLGQLGLTIDRVVRTVSVGAIDEERLELALVVTDALNLTWWARTFHRAKLGVVQWERELEQELQHVDDPDAPGTPFGVRRAVQRPALRLSDGTVIPSEQMVTFDRSPNVWDQSDADDD